MSNVFEAALIRRGIVSSVQLAERLESPAMIFFFAGPKVRRPHAELRYWDDKGREQVSEHWPPFLDMTLSACRRKTVGAAQNEAAEVLGLSQWSRSPFSNCWLPSDIVAEAHRRFMGETEPETA